MSDHEIRTPMTAILGYSDLIASRLQDPDDLQCIETIRSNGRFLVEIINDILDLSKIEADKMDLAIERVSPEAVIADVISLLEMRAREKKIALIAEVATPLPEFIQTDPVRLAPNSFELAWQRDQVHRDGFRAAGSPLGRRALLPGV